MDDDSSFADLMAAVRRGDGDAQAILWRRYVRRLIGLARARLDKRVQARHGPDDITQSVFRSVYRRLSEGEFEFRDEGGLWGLLAQITARKCNRWNAHYTAKKRDIRREAVPDFPSDAATDSWEAKGEEPTPEEAGILSDSVEALLRALPNETHRRIVELSLLQYSVPEIAAQVERSVRMVHRVRSLVKTYLQDQDRAS